MASLTRFLGQRLRLTVNLAKSAVDRPWRRSFLGYSVTAHKEPRLRVARWLHSRAIFRKRKCRHAQSRFRQGKLTRL